MCARREMDELIPQPSALPCTQERPLGHATHPTVAISASPSSTAARMAGLEVLLPAVSQERMEGEVSKPPKQRSVPPPKAPCLQRSTALVASMRRVG